MERFFRRLQTVSPPSVTMWGVVCLTALVIVAGSHAKPPKSQQDSKEYDHMEEDIDEQLPQINDSIPSCREFGNAQSYLENIWAIENNEDKSAENAQRDEIAINDFLLWYRYRGHRDLQEIGNRCASEMRIKYGQLKGVAALAYIADTRRENAEFFVREMTSECVVGKLFFDETQP
jgi:hypothetical protein